MHSIWVIVSNFVSNVYNKYIGSIICNKSWIGSLPYFDVILAGLIRIIYHIGQ